MLAPPVSCDLAARCFEFENSNIICFVKVKCYVLLLVIGDPQLSFSLGIPAVNPTLFIWNICHLFNPVYQKCITNAPCCSVVFFRSSRKWICLF